jgi:non-ribosomal peptide synthetase component E (peptide arylation enzyme)
VSHVRTVDLRVPVPSDAEHGAWEIAAAVYLPADDGRPARRHGLRAWCARRLADYQAPDRVEFLSELPLTPMLRVDKRALARRAADVTGGAR